MSKSPRSPITRRDFLEGVLVGGSSIALSRMLPGCSSADDSSGLEHVRGDVFDTCHALRDGKQWQIPAASGDLSDCIVIGSGLSGLIAAWRLRAQGIDSVLVLEKDSALGGMARRDSVDGIEYSQAAAYSVLPYNEPLIQLYQDLGVVTGLDADGYPIVDDKYLVRPPANGSWFDGTWYSDSWEAGLEALPLAANVVADLVAFREDMTFWYNFVGNDGLIGFDTPSDASTTDPAVRRLDRISLSEYVHSKGWAPEVATFFDPYCRSALGTTPDRVSAWAAINFLGAEYQPVLVQPGGTSWIALGLADKVGQDRIRTSSFVLRAAIAGEEVHVTVLEGGKASTLRARHVIWAAPRYMAPYVLPDLKAAGRHEAASFRYSPYIVANVHVSETPSIPLGYDNWVHADGFSFTDFIVADWAAQPDPANAPLSRPNVLTVYAPMVGKPRQSLLDTPIDEWERVILGDLERVAPGVRDTVVGFDLYRWGHAMLVSHRSFVFSEARVNAQRAQGPLHFACTDVDGLPAVENAVAAGWRTATEVADALG